MDNETVSLQRYGNELGITLDLLLRNIKTLIACTLLAVGLGVAYLTLASPTLEFAARLLVAPDERILEQDAKNRENEAFLPTQAEIIRSPAVIRKALGSIMSPPDEVATYEVIERLKAQPLLGTSVMTLSLQDTNEADGLKLLNAIITSYKTYLRETEQATNRETITLLLDREKELRGEMQSVQKQHDDMHNAGPLIGQDTLIAEPRARLENVQQLLSASRSRRVHLESYLRQLESLQESLLVEADAETVVPTSLVGLAAASGTTPRAKPTSTVLSRPCWAASLEILARMDLEGLVRLQDPLVRQALLDARTQEAALVEKFGPRHHEVRAIQRRIRSLESEIQQAVRVAPVILKSELESVRGQEQELLASYNKEFSRCKQLDAAVLREQQLLEQLRSVQVIHDTVLAQINRFEIAGEVISGGRASVAVRLLDGPQMMPGGTWPQPVPVLGLSGILGLAAGFLVVVVMNRVEYRPTG